MAGRSDFGAEHKHKPIECSQCRMKFSDADILANHQRQFCPKGGKGVLFGRKASAEDMEAAKEINTITADDLQRFVSGEGKQVLGVGALSIGQLRQTMNAASMDTMQARQLERQKNELAGAIRAFKSSLQPSQAGEKQQEDQQRKGPISTKSGRTSSEDGRPRSGPSIASILAQNIMKDVVLPDASWRPSSSRDKDYKDIRLWASPAPGGEGGMLSPVPRRFSENSGVGGGTVPGGESSGWSRSPSRDGLGPTRYSSPAPIRVHSVPPPSSNQPKDGHRMGKAVLLSPPTVASPGTGVEDAYIESIKRGEAGSLDSSVKRPVSAEGIGGAGGAEAGSRLAGGFRRGSSEGEADNSVLYFQGDEHRYATPLVPETHNQQQQQQQQQQFLPRLQHQQLWQQQQQQPRQPPSYPGIPIPNPHAVYPQGHPNLFQQPPSSNAPLYAQQQNFPPNFPTNFQQSDSPVLGGIPQVYPPYTGPDQPHHQPYEYWQQQHGQQQQYPYLQQQGMPHIFASDNAGNPSGAHDQANQSGLHNQMHQSGAHNKTWDGVHSPGSTQSRVGDSRVGGDSELSGASRRFSENVVNESGVGAGAGGRLTMVPEETSSQNSAAGGSLHGTGQRIGVMPGELASGMEEQGRIVDAAEALRKLRAAGEGRDIDKAESQSIDWYESIARTELERRDAAALRKGAGGVGVVVGGAIEHAHEMLELKQETERLRLMRDLTKANNELEDARMARKRDEFLLEKRFQLMEAQDLRGRVPPGSLYDPLAGFEVRIDAVTPPPETRDSPDLLLVYGLFDETGKLGPLSTSQRVEPQVNFKTGLKRSRFGIARDYVKLAPSRSVALIIELQVASGEFSSQASGWTAIPIFSPEGDVMQGTWSVPFFAPPLTIGMPWDELSNTPLVKGAPRVLVRLTRNQEAGSDDEEEEDVHTEEPPEPEDEVYVLPPHMALPTPRWMRAGYELDKEDEEEGKNEVMGVEKVDSLVIEDSVMNKAVSDVQGSVPEQAWVGYDAADQAIKPVSAPDLLVVVLDGCRFLPDNVSATRATLSLVNEEGIVGTPEATITEVADPDGGVHSPKFSMAVAVRVGELSPRTFAVVQIDSVDIYTKKSVTVGFAVFPVLLHPSTGRSPSADQARLYMRGLKAHLDSINPPEGVRGVEIARAGFKPAPRLRCQVGGLQIPLRVSPGTYAPRDPSHLSKPPRLPCCTVLVRVFINPVEEDAEEAVRAAGIVANFYSEVQDAKEVERLEAEAMLPKKKESHLLRPASVSMKRIPKMDAKQSGAKLGAGPSGVQGQGVEAARGDTRTEVERRTDDESVVRVIEKLARHKPQYVTGKYDSSTCHPTGSEIATYKIRLAQFKKDLAVKDVLRVLLAKAVDARAGGGGEASGRKSHGEGRRKKGKQSGGGEWGDREPGGNGEKVGEEEEEMLRDMEVVAKLETWAAARETSGQLISKGDGGRLPPLDLSYFCVYSSQVGFKIAIDGANNLPAPGRSSKGGIPVCLFGATLQSNFFVKERMKSDTHACCAVSIDSSQKCPRWLEGYRSIQNVPFRENLGGIIAQLAWVSGHTKDKGWSEKTNLEVIGWAAFPAFLGSRKPYLQQGCFVVPLYKGEVPVTLSRRIDEVGVERALREYEDKKIIKPLEPASIMVRLVDQQRGATASHPFPPNSDGEDLKIPSEYTDMMVRFGSLVQFIIKVRHWPESMDERFDEQKTAAFWNLQKGLFEGRIKDFKETHIPTPKKKGTAISGVDEAGLIEGLRKNLTTITGIQTVDVPAGAHAGA